MEFENRDFITEYRGNYVPQKFTFVKKGMMQQEFKDPVAESFKHFLIAGEGNAEEKTENYQNFLDKLPDKHGKIHRKYFKSPLNIDLINKNSADEKKTMYIHDFCSSVFGSTEEHEKYLKVKKDERVSLPEGWIEGNTTQRWSYRNPVILFPNIYKERRSHKIAECETDEMKKHRLNRKMISELEGTIGELGTFILENQMHGEVDKINISD